MSDHSEDPSAGNNPLEPHDADDVTSRVLEARDRALRHGNPIVDWYRSYRHPSGLHTENEARRWSAIVAAAVAVAFWFTRWPLASWTDTSPGVDRHLVQPIIWLGVAAVAFYGWLRLEDRRRLNGLLIGIAFLAGLMHVSVLIVSGLIGSTADSSLTEGFFGAVGTLWFISTLLAGVEIARAYLYAVWNPVHRDLTLAALAVGFAIVSLSAADLTPFDDLDTFSTVAGAQWAPALAVSILATFLVRLGGLGPSAAYRVALLGFAWLSPALPDLDWRVTAAIGVVLPYAAWRMIVNLFGRNSQGAKRLAAEGIPRKKSHWFLETLLGIAISVGIAVVILATGVFGYRSVVVEDASMVPTYERGDLAIVQDDPDVASLEPDDVIRFRQGDTLVLRRIVAVEDRPDGLQFITKGDNSERPDPPVAADRIEGKVAFHVSNLGHTSLWLRGDPDPPFDGARTYYESLDLGSPVAAARTFVDAFHWDDFMTVWLVFDPEAQFAFQQSFNLLDYERLIRPDRIDDMEAELREAVAIDDPDRSIDAWYLFDQLMLIADRHDAFLIDLSGTVTFGNGDVADGTAEVSAEVEGIEGEVIFRLTGSEAGRWRIHQVIVPGGDQARIPWSVPNDRP